MHKAFIARYINTEKDDDKDDHENKFSKSSHTVFNHTTVS